MSIIESERPRTIAQASAAVGVSPHTLRYYESIGLLDDVGRDGNGQRRYAEADLDRARFLTRMRACGMTIAELKTYVDLMRAGPTTGPQRMALLQRHRERVVAQAAELAECLELIDYKIANYERLRMSR